MDKEEKRFLEIMTKELVSILKFYKSHTSEDKDMIDRCLILFTKDLENIIKLLITLQDKQMLTKLLETIDNNKQKKL